MAIATPTRSFEQIKQQVGPITGIPTGAWWVGTDKTLAMRDKYFEKLDAWREKTKALAVEHDCNPEKNWVNGHGGTTWLVGFTPNDLNNPHKALREKINHPSDEIFVPNRRTKPGKELHNRTEALNNSYSTPSTRQAFTGYRGQIMKPMNGSFWRASFEVTTHRDTYPILSITETPDDNPFAEDITINPELWERIPTSWLMRIIEESENNDH